MLTLTRLLVAIQAATLSGFIVVAVQSQAHGAPYLPVGKASFGQTGYAVAEQLSDPVGSERGTNTEPGNADSMVGQAGFRMEVFAPDGVLEQRLSFTPTDEEGPLGLGIYKVTRNSDGTFNEQFSPAGGNAQPSFISYNVPAYWFTKASDKLAGFGQRLHARLAEGQIENALIRLGFDSVEVRKDVIVLESASPSLRGTFAALMPGKENKYAAAWTKERNLLGLGSAYLSHKSTGTHTGPEVPGTGFAPKLYNGGLGKGDSYPVHLGIVRANRKEHKREAARQLFAVLLRKTHVNVARENSKSLQKVTSAPAAYADLGNERP